MLPFGSATYRPGPGALVQEAEQLMAVLIQVEIHLRVQQEQRHALQRQDIVLVPLLILPTAPTWPRLERGGGGWRRRTSSRWGRRWLGGRRGLLGGEEVVGRGAGPGGRVRTEDPGQEGRADGIGGQPLQVVDPAQVDEAADCQVRVWNTVRVTRPRSGRRSPPLRLVYVPHSG